MDWISVTDRLPEDCESVLIWNKGYDPISAYIMYDSEGSAVCWFVNDWDESDITHSLSAASHWTPLPEVPHE